MDEGSGSNRGKKKKKGPSLLDTPIGNSLEQKTTYSGSRRYSYFGDRRVSVAESARRATLLERTRRKSLQLKNRCTISVEQRYNEAYLGLFSVRFSSDCKALALGFGSGAIQVF